jgi:hypothetical protein
MPAKHDIPSLSVVSTANGQTYQIGSLLEGIKFSNSIPGGFGTFHGTLRSRGNLPPSIDYGATIVVSDESGRTAYEGRIEDITTTGGSSSGYEFEAAGFQRLLDEPYQQIVRWTDLSIGSGRPLVEAVDIRPDIFSMSIGPADSNGIPSVMFQGGVQAYTAPWENSCLLKPASGFDGAVQIGSVQFELTTTGFATGTGTYDLRVYGMGQAPATYGALLGSNTTVVTNLSRSYALAAPNNYGVMLRIVCSTGGTPASRLMAQCSNIRLFGVNNITGATWASTPQTGTNIINELLSLNGLISSDNTNIEIDNSYVFQHYGHFESITCRQALDEISSYYNRYWAVWENSQLTWASKTLQTVPWAVTRAECLDMSLTGSVVDAATSLRFRYQNLKGQSREVDVADSNVDNIYKQSGLVRKPIVDLGIVAASPTAASSIMGQLAQVAFPSRSYEVMRGTVVLSAKRMIPSPDGGMKPAWMIRSGDVLQVQDIVSARDLFGSSFDRRSRFFITSVDVDFEAQTVTVGLDNTSDHLAQLLARIALGNKAVFGV